MDKKNLVLEEDLDKLKETLSMREEVFDTNLKAGKWVSWKQKIESLLDENGKLLEKLKQPEMKTVNDEEWVWNEHDGRA